VVLNGFGKRRGNEICGKKAGAPDLSQSDAGKECRGRNAEYCSLHQLVRYLRSGATERKKKLGFRETMAAEPAGKRVARTVKKTVCLEKGWKRITNVREVMVGAVDVK